MRLLPTANLLRPWPLLAALLTGPAAAAEPAPETAPRAVLAQAQEPAPWPVPVQGPGQAQAVLSRLSLAATVLAIVDYTRWPEAGRPALLCTSVGGAHGQALFETLPGHPLGRRLAIRALDPNRPVPAACDLMLFEGWDAAALGQQLRALAERPVLSVGLGAEFCSDGGIVCLSGAGGEIGFEINTDAVARAGLRINPRVLQLSRSRGRPA